ncbi:60S ribosomal protein L27 [Physocladia obscura]|uniref:60S ribosomal protein L27 n=1 Tax=Physocladia obscura TaxID=109957 RepID=A0AAD5TAE2_9FUNG|nr:60S ribosomal protein L27 [Physocladia obscura]
MVKFLKSGKVVLILSGRFAGRKAVIVKNFDEGTGAKPYPHAVIAGIERYPLKITKGMGQKRIAKRSRMTVGGVDMDLLCVVGYTKY